MSDITFSSSMEVTLIDSMGTDASIARAARVSTGKDLTADYTENAGLIKFLMKNRHGTPFEHGSMTFRISAPIFVWREFMRHRVGFCVAGSTRVPVGSLRNGVTKTIADIYRDWHEGTPDSLGRVRMLPSCRNLVTRTVNLETGLIEFARMVDVYQSGVKPVIDITLSAGNKVRCTKDHRIWTPEGWVKAGDLSVGDLVGRQGKVAVGEKQSIPPRLRGGIQEWTSQQRRHLISAVDTCHECGNIFDAGDLELDHVVPVSQSLVHALDPDNLAPICKPCHTLKSGKESWGENVHRRPLTLGVRFDAVVSIEDAGEEMTYDIEMPAPWHNFIADGVVVHNSYNEESGRYKKLEPKFYIPAPERNLVQVGKAGQYEFVPGDDEQYRTMLMHLKSASEVAYFSYTDMLDAGIAREVARMCLPLNIYSSAYVTCNPRSLMSFLSLRTIREGSTFPSFPQVEIQMVAEAMEMFFCDKFPSTYLAFNEFGRVSP